eukprot:1154234-Pelagomonas_calceolata.AAC.6
MGVIGSHCTIDVRPLLGIGKKLGRQQKHSMHLPRQDVGSILTAYVLFSRFWKRGDLGPKDCVPLHQERREKWLLAAITACKVEVISQGFQKGSNLQNHTNNITLMPHNLQPLSPACATLIALPMLNKILKAFSFTGHASCRPSHPRSKGKCFARQCKERMHHLHLPDNIYSKALQACHPSETSFPFYLQNAVSERGLPLANDTQCMDRRRSSTHVNSEALGRELTGYHGLIDYLAALDESIRRCLESPISTLEGSTLHVGRPKRAGTKNWTAWPPKQNRSWRTGDALKTQPEQ